MGPRACSICRDRHLGAQPELATVGEAGGSVDVDRRRTGPVDEPLGIGQIVGEDGIGVAGVVLAHMGQRLVHIRHQLDPQGQREPLGIEVFRAGGTQAVGARQQRHGLGSSDQGHLALVH